MTIVIEQQLQAKEHAVADVRDEFEVSGRPLLSDKLFHFLQRLGEARVNASLEHIPQVLYGVEIRAPEWPLDECHSFLMQIGDCLEWYESAHCPVGMDIPWTGGVELMEG